MKVDLSNLISCRGAVKSMVPRKGLLLGLCILTVVASLSWGGSASNTHGFRSDSGRASIAISPAASTDTISANGRDPQAISLTWTSTGDYCFDNYTLAISYAGSNGPWYVWTVISSSSTTSYVATGLAAGTTYWWSIFDFDCLGDQQGNAYQATQPADPTLSLTQPTETSATLSWGNPATYGGGLAFVAYDVYESVNGGTYTSIDSITTISDHSFTATGLSTSTTYHFYVTTIDSGSGAHFDGSSTNTVTVHTAAPLSATASVLPATADQSQSVTFSCSASGGNSPYTYSWAYGDGQTGTGASSSHRYSDPGTFTATCTATDADEVETTTTTTVTIDSNPAVLLSPDSPSILQGQSTTLTATVSGGEGPYSYSWSEVGVGCSASTGPTLSCSPSSVGSIVVTVTVTDANGVTASATSTITVKASVLGVPASQGYAEIGGGIAGAIVIGGVASLLLIRRKRAKRQPPQAQ